MSRSSRSDPRASFTLIELLIVVAIVAILAVVVILTLNPAELLRQSRDSNRLLDMDTLNKALALYQVDTATPTLGSTTTVYVSVPDASSTCGTLGLPTLPSGYSYACATSTNYTKADGTGWLPVNFTTLSSNAPFSRLPIDPTNATSSGFYYTYVPGTTTWEVNAGLEAAKYRGSSYNDGGDDILRYEKGSNVGLEPRVGLALWFKADAGVTKDGSNLVSQWDDQSGNGFNVTQGTGSLQPTWTSGAGTGGLPALLFDNSDDFLRNTSFSKALPLDIFGVVKIISGGGGNRISDSGTFTAFYFQRGGAFAPQLYNGNTLNGPFFSMTDNTWWILEGLFNGASSRIRLNNQSYSEGDPGSNPPMGGIVLGGGGPNGPVPLNGYIGEYIMYSRQLSTTETNIVQTYLNSRWAIY